MAGRVEIVEFSEAFPRLVAAIVDVQQLDPLAQITVVVPNPHAAVALRRRLASAVRHGTARRGLIGVRLCTLGELARLLAAATTAAGERRPLSRSLLAGALRVALEESPGFLAALAEHPSTESELVSAYEDLRWADRFALEAAAEGFDRSAQVARWCRRARELLAPLSVDDADLVDLGVDAVLQASHRELEANLGPVVVYLPEVIRPAEAGLLAAVASKTALGVLVARLDDEAADDAALVLLRRLGAVGLGVPCERRGASSPLALASPLAFDRVLRAPDPLAEVRAAIRLVLEALDRGVPAERCAVVAPAGGPYLELLESALSEVSALEPIEPPSGAPDEREPARLAWNGPGWRPLSDSPCATLLSRLLRLATAESLDRRAVLAFFSSAPVLDAQLRPVPEGEWERCSRLAGIVAGEPSRWRWQLEALAAQASAGGPSETAASCLALAAAVEELGERCEPARSLASWSALAEWAVAALDHYLGPPGRRPGEDLAEADAAVRQVLGDLAHLDAIEAAPGLSRFASAFERGCRRPRSGSGRLGRGVVVGGLEAVAGSALDLLIVVGCAEGDLPRRQRTSALLDSSLRERTGLEAVTTQTTLARDRRRLALALAGARQRVAIYPDHDAGSGRRRQPSRFLPKIDRQRLPGFVTDLEQGSPFLLSSFEAQCVALAEISRTGRRLSHSVLAAELGLGDRFAAAEGRRGLGFGRFSGDAGSAEVLPALAGQVLSPTSLEAYAICPFRYFLRSVLACEAIEEPEHRITIDPRERGSLVHEILQRFVGEQIGLPATLALGEPAAEAPGSAGRLTAIAEEAFARYERRGLTGKPLLWQAERRQLLRALERERRQDRERRQRDGYLPVAVEHGFGFGASPPVERLAGATPVRFRGSIDRVDRGPLGELRVVDYKTGSPTPFREIPKDPVDRGRHLQLPIYALAARQTFGETLGAVAPVRAAFRMIGREQREYEIALDGPAEERLDEVLSTLAGGTQSGLFPHHPGRRDQERFENCRWCDYDQCCPPDRAVRWQAARGDRRLSSYAALAEDEAASDG